MKLLITISLLLFYSYGSSQPVNLIKLVFSDTANLRITKSLYNKTPSHYFVLSKTGEWGGRRFKLTENLKSDSGLRKIRADEHHPYNHSYLFRDTVLNNLFSENEKEFLFLRTSKIQPRKISEKIPNATLVRSFELAPKGFLFSVTDPVVSSDNQYAFIDIVVFLKENLKSDLRSSYFGTTIIIYKNIPEKGWTKFKQRDFLIL